MKTKKIITFLLGICLLSSAVQAMQMATKRYNYKDFLYAANAYSDEKSEKNLRKLLMIHSNLTLDEKRVADYELTNKYQLIGMEASQLAKKLTTDSSDTLGQNSSLNDIADSDSAYNALSVASSNPELREQRTVLQDDIELEQALLISAQEELDANYTFSLTDCQEDTLNSLLEHAVAENPYYQTPSVEDQQDSQFMQTWQASILEEQYQEFQKIEEKLQLQKALLLSLKSQDQSKKAAKSKQKLQDIPATALLSKKKSDTRALSQDNFAYVLINPNANYVIRKDMPSDNASTYDDIVNQIQNTLEKNGPDTNLSTRLMLMEGINKKINSSIAKQVGKLESLDPVTILTSIQNDELIESSYVRNKSIVKNNLKIDDNNLKQDMKAFINRFLTDDVLNNWLEVKAKWRLFGLLSEDYYYISLDGLADLNKYLQEIEHIGRIFYSDQTNEQKARDLAYRRERLTVLTDKTPQKLAIISFLDTFLDTVN